MENINNYNYRLILIFFIFLFFYLFILFNLYILQINKYLFYKKLAKQQYQITLVTNPPRGQIYDRNKLPLAINKDSFSAFIIPNKLEDKKNLKYFLKNNFKNAYQRFKNIDKDNSNFMFIKRRLNSSEIEFIKNSNIKDIKLLKESSRYYPNETLGPIIGITDIENKGSLGVELQYNNILEGTPTIYSLCKDARLGYFYFKKKMKFQGNNAQDIYLTLDSTLQFLVYNELKDWIEKINSKEGSILIINPENGDILTIANYPDFNPNNTQNFNIEYSKNRAATDAYEMGSVIKVFLALAALEENIVKPEDLIDCENTLEKTINNITFGTAIAHGILTFSEVIEKSNNIGVAKIGLKLDKKIFQHYKKLGFGQKINIFAYENPGFINPPKKWSLASAISLSFGYEISINLLQLAQAFSVIANNGYIVKPRILLNETENKLEKIGPLYKQETIEQLRKILLNTVEYGSGKKAKITGYDIMGKTGTARLLINNKYEPNRNLFSFIGLIEKNNYKRIIALFLKETNLQNAYGANIAAPLFQKVATKMLINDKIL